MTSGVPESRWSYRPDVEGMRAVAILLVVFYHAGFSWARGGFIGVDVFFVLSGFLITGILVEEVRRTGRISLARFWARRARRLLAASALVAVAALVISALTASPYEQVARARTTLAFALYASNIWFVRQRTDYFADDVARDPLLHTWSLSLEEQYYLFYAPLALRMARLWASRGDSEFRRRVALVIAAGSIVSLAGCIWLARTAPVVAFYALPARAWEFGAGALAALLPLSIPRRYLSPVALLSVVTLVASSVLMREGAGHPGLATVPAVLASVALIVAGSEGVTTATGRLLSTRPMRVLGRLSYSWYLWHWPLLVLLADLVPEPSNVQRLLVVFGSLIPAAITYNLIESPVRQSNWLVRIPARSLVMGASLGVLVAAAGAAVMLRARAEMTTPAFAIVREAEAQPRMYADGCHAAVRDTLSVECAYGDSASSTLVVLFGDSHAAQWFPALDSAARLHRWRLLPVTKTSCPAPAVTVRPMLLQRGYTECDVWRERSIARIAELRPSVVVVTSRADYPILVGASFSASARDSASRAVWLSGVDRTVRALAASGTQVVYLADTPYPGRDVGRCLARHYRDPSRCDSPRRAGAAASLEEAERGVVSAIPGALYASLNDRICRADGCPAVRDGVPLYRDRHHITVALAQRLAKPMGDAIASAMEPAY